MGQIITIHRPSYSLIPLMGVDFNVTGLTAADACSLADDRSTWRALRPTAGYAQQ